MAYEQNLVCFNTVGSEESWTLATYEKHDGYKAWRKVLAGDVRGAVRDYRKVLDRQPDLAAAHARGGQGHAPPAALPVDQERDADILELDLVLAEVPQHDALVEDFFLMTTEVTNEQYHVYVKATGARPP